MRACTWSQYKHYNTAKYLICISPQGVITFISKGWGGCTSDKYITEHSGFLRYLKHGDVILVNRGFNDLLGCHNMCKHNEGHVISHRSMCIDWFLCVPV